MILKDKNNNKNNVICLSTCSAADDYGVSQVMWLFTQKIPNDNLHNHNICFYTLFKVAITIDCTIFHIIVMHKVKVT